MIQCEICGEDFENTQGLAGHKQFKHSSEGEKPPSSPKTLTRAQPLDAVIEQLRLPQVPDQFDGSYTAYIAGFNDGVMHGARTILAGIRAAQELSSLGISQATPVIKMAQEMRQAEGQAADKAVSSVVSQIMPFLDQRLEGIEKSLQKKPDIASTPHPMQGMMARTMESFMGQLMGTMGMGGGKAQEEDHSIPGFTYKKVKEDKNG